MTQSRRGEAACYAIEGTFRGERVFEAPFVEWRALKRGFAPLGFAELLAGTAFGAFGTS